MAMKISLTPKVRPNYDPYAFDCCGSHPGETLAIDCDGDFELKIEESNSGIGSSYKITAEAKNGQKSHPLYVFVDDSGELNFYIKVEELTKKVEPKVDPPCETCGHPANNHTSGYCWYGAFTSSSCQCGREQLE